MAEVDPAILQELEAKRLEFAEVDLPRFQTGFPPQHLLMTLLGDYWPGRREALPSAALVAWLGDFDVNEAGARAALARLAKRGNLEVVREGRNTSYRVAERLVDLLPYAALHTQAFRYCPSGWNGQWTSVAFSVADDARRVRSQLRSGLELLGFAALYDGLWVSPYAPNVRLQAILASVPEATCTVTVGVVDASTSRRLPIDAWDLVSLREAYDQFITTFGPERERMRAGELSETEALATRVKVAYRWFVLATIDPDLPAELLPADWPRNAAWDIYAELFNELGPQAQHRVRALVGRHSPVRAAQVSYKRIDEEQ